MYPQIMNKNRVHDLPRCTYAHKHACSIPTSLDADIMFNSIISYLLLKCKTYVLKNEKMFAKQNVCSETVDKHTFVIYNDNIKQMFVSYVLVFLSGTEDTENSVKI